MTTTENYIFKPTDLVDTLRRLTQLHSFYANFQSLRKTPPLTPVWKYVGRVGTRENYGFPTHPTQNHTGLKGVVLR